MCAKRMTRVVRWLRRLLARLRRPGGVYYIGGT